MMPAIEKLNDEIRSCQKCGLSETRDKAVPGEGDPSARIMLVGQAPGEVEDHKGRMFVGQSGTK